MQLRYQSLIILSISKYAYDRIHEIVNKYNIPRHSLQARELAVAVHCYGGRIGLLLGHEGEVVWSGVLHQRRACELDQLDKFFLQLNYRITQLKRQKNTFQSNFPVSPVTFISPDSQSV